VPNGARHDLSLPGGAKRVSLAQLEGLQVRQGTHSGDRFVRRARPAEEGFRRLGPGHLEALPRTLQPTTGVGRVFELVKRIVIGSPLTTAAAVHERLNKTQALAVLSSDALSSVAYATEAVLGALLLAGTRAFTYNIPISLAIALLIGIVVFSYRQTIYAYPKGGGSYIVARSNLGTIPGLIAAGSLLTDYVLTVAVSISAGVFAIISLAPAVTNFRVEACLVAIAVILLLNLRGLREAGTIFAVPTYVFLAAIFAMLGLGLFQFATGTLGAVDQVRDIIPAGDATVGLVLLLSAFSNGCTALTGIEAISDGVPAFKPPESRNAAQTLVTLGVLLGTMFLGISFLADHIAGVHPSTTESVVSQIGRTVFDPIPFFRIGDHSGFWQVLQWATALILVLAANTSFSDFPRLSFFLARDRFLPHQFAFRGDRLAYSFGILTLAVLAGVLIMLFNGDTTALLPLYAIGVFSSFTLSQSGMVARWWRLRTPGWQRSAGVNGFGALTTLSVLLILTWTKFAEGQALFTVGSFTIHAGAWIILVVVPLLMLMFLRIRRHYTQVSRALSLEQVDPQVGRAAAQGATFGSNPLVNLPNAAPLTAVAPVQGEILQRIEHLVVMPVAGLNQVTLRTLAYARSITGNVVAVHVAADEDADAVEKLEAKWHKWVPDVPLVIVDSPYRSLLRPLLSYIDALHRQQPDRVLTVLIPEFVASRWWEHLLHNQSALRLKGSLLFRPGIVVTSVPYHIAERTQA
jgi:amino acid transporter